MLKANVVKSLVDGPSTSTIPPASQRFGRSDQKEPTLFLTGSTVNLGVTIFTNGKFKIARHFEDLTKEYLAISSEDHEKLVANLVVEATIKKLEKQAGDQGSSGHLNMLKNQLLKIARDLRVCQVNYF